MADELNLHSLQPAQPRKARKRIGRGLGSGKGRYSRARHQGPEVALRLAQDAAPGSRAARCRSTCGSPKLRGNTSADAMPIGPFRTYSQPVNLRDLEARFDAGDEVTPEALKAKRLIRKVSVDVKMLGVGELSKALTVSAHGFSKTAKEKIEAAGGIDHLAARRARREEAEDAQGEAHGDGRRRRGRRRGARPPRPPPTRRPTRPTGRTSPALAGSRHVQLARQRLARAGAPAPPAVHGVRPRRLPARLLDPRPGRRRGSDRPATCRARGGIFSLLNLFSGGALSQFSLFALGIMPYVTASIILQLMTVVIPRLSELQKEGESGYAKINQYTRYLTVVLAAAQALGYAFLFQQPGRARRRTPGGWC